jgi:hypothetical protein
VSDQRGVVVVGDDDAGDAFGAAVGVEGVVCFLCKKVFRVISSFNRIAGDVPCSSTSCRCPGRVRSATVLLNRVMNSP